MFGLLLIFTSSVFSEIGTSIGKYEVTRRKESVYSLGFLNMLFGTLFFLGLSLTVSTFTFSLASLPTFIPRVILEIVLGAAGIFAVMKADRSTFAFIHIWTVPLLLLADLALGYPLTSLQIAGIAVIMSGFSLLMLRRDLNMRGAGYALIGTILAVATISLFKYDITHYNSVAAEQGITSLVLLIFYFLLARIIARENPFFLLRKRAILLQSAASGLSQVFASFAYLFATASVITTASRAFDVAAAIISGNRFFGERKLAEKLAACVIVAAGILLLAN